MSSLPPSGARSLTPDADPAHRGVVRDRGRALIDALDQHIPGAREHAEATGAYAFAAAAALGFDRNTAELCRETAKLHDIGKLYVPKEILARPAAELDEAGRERMRSQHEAGAGLALGSGIPEEVCVWIRAAGESFDGSGPQGLKGDEIPIVGRITRAACECDRLLSDPEGPDEAPQRRDAALAGLRRQLGRALDPAVVAALASVLREAA